MESEVSRHGVFEALNGGEVKMKALFNGQRVQNFAGNVIKERYLHLSKWVRSSIN